MLSALLTACTLHCISDNTQNALSSMRLRRLNHEDKFCWRIESALEGLDIDRTTVDRVFVCAIVLFSLPTHPSKPQTVVANIHLMSLTTTTLLLPNQHQNQFLTSVAHQNMTSPHIRKRGFETGHYLLWKYLHTSQYFATLSKCFYFYPNAPLFANKDRRELAGSTSSSSLW